MRHTFSPLKKGAVFGALFSMVLLGCAENRQERLELARQVLQSMRFGDSLLLARNYPPTRLPRTSHAEIVCYQNWQTDALFEQVAGVFAEGFDKTELRALLAFYQSASGQKVVQHALVEGYRARSVPAPAPPPEMLAGDEVALRAFANSPAGHKMEADAEVPVAMSKLLMDATRNMMLACQQAGKSS